MALAGFAASVLANVNCKPKTLAAEPASGIIIIVIIIITAIIRVAVYRTICYNVSLGVAGRLIRHRSAGG